MSEIEDRAREIIGNCVEYGVEPDFVKPDPLLALKAAGLEVVPIEVADAAQKALMQAPTRFAGREGPARRICCDWRHDRVRGEAEG